jgi:hypothetical protein
VNRPEAGNDPPWEVLVVLAGAATAIVLFLYLIGGAIIWTRLHVLGLPANHGVAPLPRELLLVVGVRALAWPLVLGLLAIAAIQSVSPRLPPPPWTAVSKALLAVVLALYVASLVIAAIYLTVQQVIFLSAFGVLVGVGVTLASRNLVGLRKAGVAVFLSMVAVGVIVEANDIYQLPVRLEYADVHFTTGKEVKGFLIGVTADTVYLAPNKGCHVMHHILAVSRQDVRAIDIHSSSKAWPEESRPAVCASPR